MTIREDLEKECELRRNMGVEELLEESFKRASPEEQKEIVLRETATQIQRMIEHVVTSGLGFYHSPQNEQEFTEELAYKAHLAWLYRCPPKNILSESEVIRRLENYGEALKVQSQYYNWLRENTIRLLEKIEKKQGTSNTP